MCAVSQCLAPDFHIKSSFSGIFILLFEHFIAHVEMEPTEDINAAEQTYLLIFMVQEK